MTSTFLRDSLAYLLRVSWQAIKQRQQLMRALARSNLIEKLQRLQEFQKQVFLADCCCVLNYIIVVLEYIAYCHIRNHNTQQLIKGYDIKIYILFRLKERMYCQNYQTKIKLFKTIEQSLPICQNYSSIGLDCHCLIGHDMQRIHNTISCLRKAQKEKKLNYLDKIREQGDLLVNNFIRNIEKLLYLFDREQIYAVFDGTKIKFPGKARGFNWNPLPGPEITHIREDSQRHGDEWPQFLSYHYYIIHTLKFLTHAMGVHVVEAPHEADHQLVKMFYEKRIQCVLSHDHGYVDYGVPLVKRLTTSGMGEVIDFTKVELSNIEDGLMRSWIRQTRDISKPSSLLKRIYLGILCGGKYIEAFKTIPTGELMNLLIEWKPENENFTSQIIRKHPNIYFPLHYLERFYNVELLSLYATVKSLKNKRIEPLFADHSGVLREGSQAEVRFKKSVVGETCNYSVYSSESYSDVVPMIGDKSREEILRMEQEDIDDWLFSETEKKEWFSIDLSPEEVKSWLGAQIQFVQK